MRFIAGIVTTPVVSTLETTLPDTEPIRPLAKIATLAGRPRTEPKRANAGRWKKGAAPVNCSPAPNMTKPIASSPKARVGMPSALSLEAKWNDAVDARSRGRPEIGPGMGPADTGDR